MGHFWATVLLLYGFLLTAVMHIPSVVFSASRGNRGWGHGVKCLKPLILAGLTAFMSRFPEKTRSSEAHKVFNVPGFQRKKTRNNTKPKKKTRKRRQRRKKNTDRAQKWIWTCRSKRLGLTDGFWLCETAKKRENSGWFKTDQTGTFMGMENFSLWKPCLFKRLKSGWVFTVGHQVRGFDPTKLKKCSIHSNWFKSWKRLKVYFCWAKISHTEAQNLLVTFQETPRTPPRPSGPLGRLVLKYCFVFCLLISGFFNLKNGQLQTKNMILDLVCWFVFCFFFSLFFDFTAVIGLSQKPTCINWDGPLQTHRRYVAVSFPCFLYHPKAFLKDSTATQIDGWGQKRP